MTSPLSRALPRLSMYYLQRLMTGPALRGLAITLLRGWVALRTWRARQPGEGDGQVLARLRSDGIAPVGQVLSEAQCRDILAYLAEKPVSCRDMASFVAACRPGGAVFGNHALADLVSCPHILELANSPALLALARRYLGCTPTISGLSARWSFPAASTTEVVQKFHRDSEDWLAFRVMVYLTPVGKDAGPHVYVKGSHLDRRTVRLPVLEDEAVEQRFGAAVVRQTGGQGFCFAVDTAGLHKGEVPRTTPRLLLSFQYSILPCFLYEYTPEPVPALVHDPYINRLIVRGPHNAGMVNAPDALDDDLVRELG